MGPASNGSSLASSQLSSLSPSKQSSSEISKVYKQASQLFLTRRLAECLSVIQPVISPPEVSEDGRRLDDDDPPPQAPIATASGKLRIKIWSLYISLLNAIIELGTEEGRKTFGNNEWRTLVSSVRDGDIWEYVVKNGYGGHEGSVDADVITNLATLLLGHATSQTVNQQRLENYLSSSHHPDLDLDSFSPYPPNGQNGTRSRHNGTDTPRDLDSRIKILEIFTLHVLPRNEEWEYATEFISSSYILDEDRREAFLQTLQQLRDEKVKDSKKEEDLQRERDEDLARQCKEDDRRRAQETREEEKRREREADGKTHKRASSEVDYGIEKSNPNGRPTSKNDKNAGKSAISGRTTFSPPPRSPKQTRKSEQSRDTFKQTRAIMTALQRLIKNMASSMSANPMLLLRAILFLVAIILAFSRRDVRDRLRRITGTGWEKVRNTVGMGVKVSYI